MTIGQLVRKILGPRFNTLGKLYRGFFLNTEAFMSVLPDFGSNQRVIDIGGGDGEIINEILNRNKGMRVSLIDISENIGGMIDNRNRNRVKLYRGYSMKRFRNSRYFNTSDYIIVSDTIHHVPVQERPNFFEELLDLCTRNSILIIKDIQPGHIKAFLSLVSDRYISGDSGTALISQEQVLEFIRRRFPKAAIRKTELYEKNPPNYCLIVTNFR